MDNYLLTFEIVENGEQIEIHGDAVGLSNLANQLLKLASRLDNGKMDHDNFMIAEWGGEELSSEQQCIDGRLIHHVKVVGWPDGAS